MPTRPNDHDSTAEPVAPPPAAAGWELHDRARQQEAVALIGRRALAAEPIDALLELSVSLLRDTLDVDFATVLALQPDGTTLLIEAGAGWGAGVVGRATVEAGVGSQAGYTLLSGQAVAVEDLGRETRFRAPDLARDHGIVSGLSVIVSGTASVYGVLIVHSRRRRSFTPNEVHYLQTVADVLAQAIEHDKVEAKLRFQAQLLDAVGEAVIATDLDGDILYWNRKAEELYGWAAEEALGKNVVDLTPSRVSRDEAIAVMARLERGESWSGEIELQHRDGTRFPVHVMDSPIRDGEGRLVGIVGASHDLSERKALEQQFRQAQRMEAIGRLAGGIAHDFNNILTVIFGYSQSLASALPAGTPSRDAADQVLRAARRAADLTRQLLAFSRKQILQPRTLDLGRVVGGMVPMLRRLLGEDVELAVEVEPSLGSIHADPGQIEQVLMNLVVNSRDAMPTGGRLGLRVADVVSEGGPDAEGDEMPPGAYVVLVVEDSGTGIPREVLEHVFEPFFTTKETGKGTGLGLSTVYGIVKQSGGYVRVESQPGAGTRFEVYLPRTEAAASIEEAPPEHVLDLPRGRGETVLIVEDEEAVRRLASAVLERLGYRVLEADGPAFALERVLPDSGAEIDLLLTDVVMPGIGGAELVRRVAELHPRMRTIFMSGHAEDEMSRRGVQDAADRFLEKPFTLAALAHKVREVLDAGAPESAGG